MAATQSRLAHSYSYEAIITRLEERDFSRVLVFVRQGASLVLAASGSGVNHSDHETAAEFPTAIDYCHEWTTCTPLQCEEIRSLFGEADGEPKLGAAVAIPILIGPPPSDAIGVLVVASPDGEVIEESDVRFLELECLLCSRDIEITRLRQELAWHEKATNQLPEAINEIVRLDCHTPHWLEQVDQSADNRQHRRSDRRRGERRSLVKRLSRILAHKTAWALRKPFKLTRCAVLLPAGREAEFWTYVSQFGFPEHAVQDGFYRRGEGLTGQTLECSPGHVVSSEDIEADPNWSRKLGSSICRNASEQQKRPLCFLGVPVFSRFHKSGDLPEAVIVCVRSAISFRPEEVRQLQVVSAQLAYAFDTLRWREDVAERRNRQSELNQIWESHKDEQTKLSESLSLLQKEAPFQRLLLSLVNDSKQSIIGRAVVGFHPSLIADTVRTIFMSAPEIPGDEDVLAKICRLKERKPRLIDPNQPDPDWSPHLHNRTANRHGVRNPVVLIPMVNRQDDVMGVILAEFPDQAESLSPNEIEHFSVFAKQLSTLIELTRNEAQTDREQKVTRSLIRSVCRDGSVFAEQQTTLNELLQAACESCEFDQGLIYAFDRENDTLQGVAGYRVNAVEFQKTTYNVSVSALHEDNRSFAKEVFRRGEPVFIEDISEAIVNASDRKRVGIGNEVSGFGVPLRAGRAVLGVMLLFSSEGINPSGRMKTYLMSLAELGALALAVRNANQSFDLIKREAAAEETIIHHIGRLAENRPDRPAANLAQISEHEAESLTAIVNDAARLFQAELCGLFLADETVRFPVTSDGSKNYAQGVISQQSFRLRAGHNYSRLSFENDELAYRSQTKALTSSVLRTLKPQVSSWLQDDDRWSKKFVNEIQEAVTDLAAPRSWMGVPVITREGNHDYLYGVLTFTRVRHNEKRFIVLSRSLRSDER